MPSQILNQLTAQNGFEMVYFFREQDLRIPHRRKYIKQKPPTFQSFKSLIAKLKSLKTFKISQNGKTFKTLSYGWPLVSGDWCCRRSSQAALLPVLDSRMSTEPTSIEGSITPPTSIDSENSGIGALSQAKGTTGKRKATPQSHKGESIGMVIEKCLLNWGIDKLFTVTVDNASSNDVAIGYLRKKFNPRGGLVQNGKYLHMRCMAHIVNLIVVEGLKEMNKSVERVRGLLDMWNSTSLMLDTAQNFERAFERFEEQDTNFRAELERGEGWPSVDDWDNVRNLRDFLEHFYEVTLHISGTSYVTSNNFFNELSEIDILLRDAQLNSNVDFNVMAIKMKEKYDKYWGDIDKMNLLIFVACVLDPRQKLKYLEFALSEMSSSKKACEMMQKLKESLYELFDEYKPPLHSTCSQLSVPTHVSLGEPQQKMKRRMQALYKKRELEICGEDKTSDLDKYLAEANEEFVEDFDILLWWKVNSPRFPTLSKMAKDVLAIPVSTVALESAFSIGGHVLDQYRSSLTPKIVQVLVCTQDWIRKSLSQEDIKKIEEQIQELDKIENGLMQMEIFWREEMDTNGEY
ncbi:hypothetical protein CXB51_010630 [Gossypium anomalum]|uniref:Zinc finger BED domain-containing protein RICESLEEPER 2-like n=1 Tax=Gossypium anomalum TaxID=47600 RepID=A0A8J6D6M0_9ROSI|nr:hypothetical protein CXB51_010630 [Gossypium anomalum]